MDDKAISVRGPKPRQSGRVRDAILRLINSGAFAKGHLLPTEQELAILCRASQPTVNREIKRLVESGIIAINSDGQRVIGGQPSGLLERTIAVFSAYNSNQGMVPGKVLPQWENNLELIAESILMAGRWRPWRFSANDLNDSELSQLSQDTPAGALVFADGLGRVLADRVISALDRARIKTVIHGSSTDYPNHDTVHSNQTKGAAAVARWLASKGCRQLVAVSRSFPEREPVWHVERQRGYRLGAKESGVEAPAILQKPHGVGEAAGKIERFRMNAEHWAKALGAWKQAAKPIGILALSDGDVPALWSACRILNLQPGRDILISGYDGYWADLMERSWEKEPPSVSTDKRHPEMAAALADILIKRVEKVESLISKPIHLRIEPKILENQ